MTVTSHRLHGAGSRASIDPHAAIAEVRIGGSAFVLAGASRPVRALAQRLLGGPDELAAPRPLSTAEHAIWALALASAIEDTGVAAEVWPLVELDPDLARSATQIEITVDLAGTPYRRRAVPARPRAPRSAGAPAPGLEVLRAGGRR